MAYTDIISLNKDFQYSVNIGYDLNNLSKIKEYIPTTDVCDVLKKYINSILGYDKDKATTLIGPYGKGKSFLILVLLQLVSYDLTVETNELIAKIKQVDEDLYNLILEMKEKKIKLLPIIIDSNYFNLNQSFLLGLRDALRTHNLENIVPKTAFNLCIDLLNKWIKNDDVNLDIFEKCLEITETSVDTMLQELNAYNMEAYYKFEKLYNCITTGLEFNPMINTDIVKTYNDTINAIKEHGYSGVFIVYDEFSKTLDSKNEYLHKDLKIIQDFAEVANRSSVTSQLNLCCITHKSLNAYYENKDKDIKDSFKTVEGRFKEVKFNRSLEQNYQIIGFTLKKINNFNKISAKFVENNLYFYNEIEKTSIIPINFEETIISCFPFNPISVNILIRLSELVAQNERTLFTLISDNDENSFNSFINNNENGLYNVDKIFDYFETLIKEDKDQFLPIWLKYEGASIKVSKDIHKRILKVIAILTILNDEFKLPKSSKIISLCLFENEKIIVEELETLIELGVIKKVIGSIIYDFAYTQSKEIVTAVNKFKLTNNSTTKFQYINAINNKKFIISRQYNMEYKMTRYFNIFYCDFNYLVNIKDFSILYEKEFADGYVLNIVDANENSLNKIREIYDKTKNNENIVLKISKTNKLDLIEEAENIYALKKIKDNFHDELVKEQVNLIINERTSELRNVINEVFSDINSMFITNENIDNFKNIYSNMLTKSFKNTPIINNEMINKNNVTSAYTKAQDNVSKIILNNLSIDEYSSTSPERTVFNSFYKNKSTLRKDVEVIVELIKEKLVENNNKKNNLTNLIKTLKSRPYGLRDGIIPILLICAIKKLDNNVVLYFNENEIAINFSNINKAVKNYQKYSILVAEKFESQSLYLEKIINGFGGKNSSDFTTSIQISKDILVKWVNSLPLLIKNNSIKDNYLNIEDEKIYVIKELLKFDLNPYELLFKTLPNIFGDDLECVAEKIIDLKLVDECLVKYEINVLNKLKIELVDNDRGSLKNCFKEWSYKYQINFDNLIFEKNYKKVYNIFANANYDDLEILNLIASELLGYAISDWAIDNKKYFLEQFCLFLESLKSSSSINAIEEMDFEETPLGEMFKNNLESIIDEFGDSVTNSEKIYILKKMIEKFEGGN